MWRLEDAVGVVPQTLSDKWSFKTSREMCRRCWFDRGFLVLLKKGQKKYKQLLISNDLSRFLLNIWKGILLFYAIVNIYLLLCILLT